MKETITNFMVDNVNPIMIGLTATSVLVTGGIWAFLISKYDF